MLWSWSSSFNRTPQSLSNKKKFIFELIGREHTILETTSNSSRLLLFVSDGDKGGGGGGRGRGGEQGWEKT